MASRLVSPLVEGVINHVIISDKESNAGYVASYIPQSYASPHRAEHHNLKKYYQRSGDSFIQMEHYQLEYMFGRRFVPELRFSWDIIPLAKDPSFTEGILNLDPQVKDHEQALLRIGVSNKGKAIAKYTCLRIHFRFKNKRIRLNQKYKHNLINYDGPQDTHFKTGYKEITARARPGLVVYPADRLNFFEFRIRYKMQDILNDKLNDFTLYYDLYAENFRGIIGQKLTISKDVMSKILKPEQSS